MSNYSEVFHLYGYIYSGSTSLCCNCHVLDGYYNSKNFFKTLGCLICINNDNRCQSSTNLNECSNDKRNEW